MNIPELMGKLGQARQASQDAYEVFRMHKQIEDEVRDELDMKLRSEGLRSAKNEDYIVSITSKPVVRITDEQAALDWVRRQPVETDMYIGLKKVAFDGLAKMALKQNGELVPGIDLENIEYLAIKKVKKED